jgi:hypothetical protein
MNILLDYDHDSIYRSTTAFNLPEYEKIQKREKKFIKKEKKY